jgi:hypothetical protein
MAGACVFIAGHGRMTCGAKTETVPKGFSVGWAVPEKCASQPQVSRTMIAGQHRLLSDLAEAGENYNEHWLCPDGADMMIRKARDLRDSLDNKAGFRGSLMTDSPSSYWILQPKGDKITKLSSILEHLRTVIGAGVHIDVLWTCCRSPVGSIGNTKASVNADATGYITSNRPSSAIIADPSPNYSKADGAVTLVQASKPAIYNPSTWQGMKREAVVYLTEEEDKKSFMTHLKLPDQVVW